MLETRRTLGLLFAAAAVLGVAGPGRPAPAQDLAEDDIVADAPRAPAPGVQPRRPGIAAAAVQQPQFMVDDAYFDRLAFGAQSGGRTVRGRLEDMLRLQVDEIDRDCRLNPAQRAKLELAGRGDIARFFEQVDAKRREFQAARTDRLKIVELNREIQPIQQRMQGGIFGEGSLFAKVAAKALDPEQVARHEAARRDRQKFRHRSKIDLIVAMMDTAAGLTTQQRQRLSRLIEEETRPPKKAGPYDYQVMMLQLARLPEEKIKPIFSPAQWRLVEVHFNNAKRLEPMLARNGYLPDEPADDGAKAKGGRIDGVLSR